METIVIEQESFCVLRVLEDNLSQEVAKSLIDSVGSMDKPVIIFDLSQIKQIETNALTTIVNGLKNDRTKLVYIGQQFVTQYLHKEGLQKKFMSYEEFNSVDNSDSISEKQFNEQYQIFTDTLKTEICTIFNQFNIAEFSLIKEEETFNFPVDKVEFCASVELCTTPFLGSMIMGFHQETFLPIIRGLFNKEDINLEETKGGVAELVNITLAKLRTILNSKGFGIEMRPPIVIREPGMSTNKKLWSASPSTFLTFSDGQHEFYVEVIVKARG